MGLGSKLQALLDKNEMTPIQLSKRIGVPEQTIYSLIKRDGNKVSVNVLISICELFKVDASFFIDEEDDRERPASMPAAPTIKAQRIGRAYDKADPPIKAIVETALKPYMPDESRTDTEFAAELVPFPAKKPLPLLLQAVAAGLGNFIDSNDYDEVEFENVPKRANIAVRITGDSMTPKYNPDDIVFVETDSILDDGDIGIFRYDDNGYIKQLRLNPPRLVSLNKAYADIMLDDNFDCRVIGRVVGKA